MIFNEETILENIIRPEVPKVLPNQQIVVYIPDASTNKKGISRFDATDFVVDDGNVRINLNKYYTKPQIGDLLDELSGDISEAEQAAKDYSDAQDVIQSTELQGYADTVSSAAEQAAKIYALDKANTAEQAAKSYALDKANTAEANAMNYANLADVAQANMLRQFTANYAYSKQEVDVSQGNQNTAIGANSRDVNELDSRIALLELQSAPRANIYTLGWPNPTKTPSSTLSAAMTALVNRATGPNNTDRCEVLDSENPGEGELWVYDYYKGYNESDGIADGWYFVAKFAVPDIVLKSVYSRPIVATTDWGIADEDGYYHIIISNDVHEQGQSAQLDVTVLFVETANTYSKLDCYTTSSAGIVDVHSTIPFAGYIIISSGGKMSMPLATVEMSQVNGLEPVLDELASSLGGVEPRVSSLDYDVHGEGAFGTVQTTGGWSVRTLPSGEKIATAELDYNETTDFTWSAQTICYLQETIPSGIFTQVNSCDFEVTDITSSTTYHNAIPKAIKSAFSNLVTSTIAVQPLEHCWGEVNYDAPAKLHVVWTVRGI